MGDKFPTGAGVDQAEEETGRIICKECAMKEKPFDINLVENLLSSSEGMITLLPVTAIKESDHAFFWCAFFLSIASCLFGCAVSLYASAYEHLPFIALLAIFGLLFLIFFLVFSVRGLQIRKRARTRQILKRPGEVAYPRSSSEGPAGRSISRMHDGIREAFGDGRPRSREEIIGTLSAMSTDEVDVGTLHQVLHTLVDVGLFSETEENGKKCFIFQPEAAATA
jgi:hypothetical protein